MQFLGNLYFHKKWFPNEISRCEFKLKNEQSILIFNLLTIPFCLLCRLFTFIDTTSHYCQFLLTNTPNGAALPTSPPSTLFGRKQKHDFKKLIPWHSETHFITITWQTFFFIIKANKNSFQILTHLIILYHRPEKHDCSRSHIRFSAYRIPL